MKNKKDRMVVLIVYSMVIVLCFILACTFCPEYILLRVYPLQFSLVFTLGIAIGIFLRELL